MQGKLALEQIGHWGVANSHEHSVDRHGLGLAGGNVTHSDPGDLGRVHVEYLVDDVAVHHSNLWIRNDALLHHPRRAQRIPAMHERHALTEPGKVRSFLHRGVPAPNHRHIAIAEQRPVADGAGTHPTVLERFLALEAQIVGTSTGSDDECLALMQHVLAFADPDLEGMSIEIYALNVRRNDLGSLGLSLLAQQGHQLLTLNSRRKSGEILDVGRKHELSAGNEPPRVEPLDAGGLQIGSSRIDGRGEAGGTGSYDEYSVARDICHGRTHE